MRLWLRLFIACALLSTASLVGFVAWQRLSFARGFTDYLDAVADERMVMAAKRLATRFRQEGTWNFLREDPAMFGAMVDPSAPDGPPPSRVGGPARSPPPPAGRPGVPPDHGDHQPFDERGLKQHARNEPGPPRRGGPSGQPPDAGRQIGLFDQDNRFVAGNPEASASTRQIPVMLDAVRIGTLRSARSRRDLLGGPGSLEAVFAQTQLTHLIAAGTVVLLLALGVAFALSRSLLGPVKALAAGANSLTGGDYAQRIAVTGKDELAALSHAFNTLASTLEAHREARRRWGADIAHELRTPVAVLRAELTTLIERVRPTNEAALRSLMHECDRLAALTEDLYQLALADVGALEYRFETIDLVDVVGDADHRQHRALAERGLVLETEWPEVLIPVRGDRARLTQLLDNLLVNSSRYTDAPGRVALRVGIDGRMARLSIDDTAPGVPSEALPRLFDRLFTVDRSRSRKNGGSGLGLAICRSIVDAHGAAITATQSALGGLRVVVEIPLAHEGET